MNWLLELLVKEGHWTK